MHYALDNATVLLQKKEKPMGYMGISLWSVSKFVAVAAFVLVTGVILTQAPAFAISTGNLTGRMMTDAGAPIA
ncbi:MAG TPA: hypothetical protein VN860_00050, partial [Candidatus Acidoferrales bacterium]|nr:hypothetical protein [Candidatus Acidoferrales bacterium]